MPDVFISYSHKNSAIADEIAEILSSCGIDFFKYERDVGWGQSITGEVHEKLKASKALIPILSPASLKSNWVMFEIGLAYGADKSVLPYLSDPDLEIPAFIRDLRCTSSLVEVRNYFSGIKFKSLEKVQEKRYIEPGEYLDTTLIQMDELIKVFSKILTRAGIKHKMKWEYDVEGKLAVFIDTSKPVAPSVSQKIETSAQEAGYGIDNYIYFGIDSSL